MNVRQLRAVLGCLQVRHERLRSYESAAALKDLRATMQGFDQETVSAFVKRATPRKKTASRTSTSKRSR